MNRDVVHKRFRNIVGLVSCTVFFELCGSAETQQTPKVPRIGIVVGIAEPNNPSITVFRQALQDLGHFEGKNIRFEFVIRKETGSGSREL